MNPKILSLIIIFMCNANIGSVLANDEFTPVDEKRVEKIRKSFLALEKPLEVEYTLVEPKGEGRLFYVFNKPMHLKIKLKGNIEDFFKGIGYLETNCKCEPIFALWPFLNDERYQKEAFVLLFSFSNDYAYRLPKSKSLPYVEGFDENEWEKEKKILITKVANICKRMLTEFADKENFPTLPSYDPKLLQEKIPAEELKKLIEK